LRRMTRAFECFSSTTGKFEPVLAWLFGLARGHDGGEMTGRR
jgi:hypothetical protein